MILLFRLQQADANTCPEKPSAKFGEALRDQVEERLKFFETGDPPTKNAEAIRKVLDALALEVDEDDDVEAEDNQGEPALPLLETTPKKKRKSTEDVDVDEKPSKKRKLSKEEKKALKKEKKEKKEEEAAEVEAEVSTNC